MNTLNCTNGWHWEPDGEKPISCPTCHLHAYMPTDGRPSPDVTVDTDGTLRARRDLQDGERIWLGPFEIGQMIGRPLYWTSTGEALTAEDVPYLD